MLLTLTVFGEALVPHEVAAAEPHSRPEAIEWLEQLGRLSPTMDDKYTRPEAGWGWFNTMGTRPAGGFDISRPVAWNLYLIIFVYQPTSIHATYTQTRNVEFTSAWLVFSGSIWAVTHGLETGFPARLHPLCFDEAAHSNSTEVLAAHIRAFDAVRDKGLWKQLEKLLEPAGSHTRHPRAT